LVVWVFLAAATSAWAAETPPVPIPPASEMLARVRPEHPRLLLLPEGLAQLKGRIAGEPQLQEWQARLREQAKQIEAAGPSRYEIPDGLRLLNTSRRVVHRVYTLALLYRLEGEMGYAERAWRELEAAANFPDWNPRHFLDTAEMTHAFAIGYDWLYQVWTPGQRAVLRQAMVEKGLKPALALYRGHSGWTRARHNWNQVCNGGIGIGALALAQDEPALAGEALEAALESIQLAMSEFAPDGAWKEGPGYWNYATSYNVTLLAGLETALETDLGLGQMKGFGETGLFPLYLTGPGGHTFNYADGGESVLRAPQMFWLARRFRQPVCAWYERLHAAPEPMDLVWHSPEGTDPQAAGLPLDKHFREAEVAALRSGWEDPRALFVGFKAGDNKANHSHLDVGSFVFDALGARWAAQLGADDYNLPGYFGGQRWHYYRLRAEGQNTLLLNPDAGPDQDPAAATKIVRFDSKPSKAFAVADLTPAYAKHAQKVWRGVALLDRKELLVQDEIQAQKPADLWWFVHTRASVTPDESGRKAVLKQGGAQVLAEILSPANAHFEVREARPLPSSPHPERQATNDNVRKLAIHLPGVTEARLAVRLLPLADNQPPAPPAPKLTPLSKW
jgi:hypothetical protein